MVTLRVLTCFLVVTLVSVTSQEVDDRDVQQHMNVVESLAPLREYLLEDSNRQNVSDQHVRTLSGLLWSNAELQSRVQQLEREAGQCSANQAVLDETRRLHAEQLARVSGEKQLALANCDLMVQLAQLQVKSCKSELGRQKSVDTVTLTDETVQLRTELQSLRTSKNDLQRDLQLAKTEHGLEVNSLKNSLQAVENRASNLRQQLQDLSLEKVALLSNLTKVREDATLAIQVLHEKHTNNSLETLKENLQLKLNNSQLINLNVILEQKNLDLNNEIIILKNNNNLDCQGKYEKLQSELGKITQENEKLSVENQKITQTQEKLLKENNELLGINRNYKETVTRLQTLVSDLNLVLKEAKQGQNDLKQDIDVLKQSKAETERENERLRSERQENTDLSRVDRERMEQELRMLKQEFAKYKKSCYKIIYWG